MIKRMVLIVAGTIITLTGCSKIEPVQTVEWYKTHETECKEVLIKCTDDSGQFQTTPNCVNATEAKEQLVFKSIKKIDIVPLMEKFHNK